MLLLQAEIRFDAKKDKHGLDFDLSTEQIIRPTLKFGNDLLFSGTIIAEANVAMLKREEDYNVMIEMPTIEKEAFDALEKVLHIEGTFKIQRGARIIGKGRIIDILYE